MRAVTAAMVAALVWGCENPGLLPQLRLPRGDGAPATTHAEAVAAGAAAAERLARAAGPVAGRGAAGWASDASRTTARGAAYGAADVATGSTPGSPDPARPDYVRPDSVPPDSVSPDSVRPDSVRPDASRPVTGNIGPLARCRHRLDLVLMGASGRTAMCGPLTLEEGMTVGDYRIERIGERAIHLRDASGARFQYRIEQPSSALQGR